jgi:O-antigen/teichoic acid export membrane protein
LSDAQQADLAALAKGGRTNVIGFLIRLAARVPFLFIAGRIYGPEALGRMAYAVLVVEFAAQIATMGLKRGLALQLTSDTRGPGHVVWDALLLVFVISAPLTIGLMMFPQAMFPNSEINGLEMLLPLVVFAFAATDVMLAALAYRFNVGATVTARAIVEPWTISIAAFALSWWSLRDGLLLAYAISMFAAFVAALVPFVRTYEWPGNWRPDGRTIVALARRNLPLAAADAVEWGSRRIDLAILGLFVSPAAVGVYYVAQQLASLPQKLKTSFDPVLGPVITRNLDVNDRPAIAAAISQVGFWILAAQAGIALALGIPGAAVMGLIGKKSVFVGGNGALAFLLIAEVLAATAVVSEAALVYIARHRNLMVSLVALGLQAGLSFGFILWMLERGYPELWIAAAPALALALSLGFSAIVKSKLAARLLKAPISLWRWPLLLAAAASAAVGGLATATPEWSELLLGVPAMLAVYCWVIWRFGFKPEDRKLFAKTAFSDAPLNDESAASR